MGYRTSKDDRQMCLFNHLQAHLAGQGLIRVNQADEESIGKPAPTRVPRTFNLA